MAFSMPSDDKNSRPDFIDLNIFGKFFCSSRENFSKTKSVNVNYRGDAQQPGFGQLQDVRDSSNLQYQTNGNPNLKPSINHTLNFFYNDFNFTKGRVLFSSFSVSTIQNQVITRTIQLDAAGKPERRYVLTGTGTVPVRETVNVLARGGYRGYYCLEWEKRWHPELEEPEIAFPHYAKVMREYLAAANVRAA